MFWYMQSLAIKGEKCYDHFCVQIYLVFFLNSINFPNNGQSFGAQLYMDIKGSEKTTLQVILFIPNLFFFIPKLFLL